LKKLIFISVILQLSCSLNAQQLPYYTQFVSNAFMLNPAITGTKGLVNATMDYRSQWVGYDGAPQTSSASLHSRFLNGTMGAGLYVMQDKVGPTQQTNVGGSYAYHIRFPDCELSAGVAGNYTKFAIIGSKVLLHNSQDPSIDQFNTNSVGIPDASAGVYLYNDRFHIGFSALHLLKSQADLLSTKDSTKKGLIKYFTQLYATLGYNYSQTPNFIFENNLFCNYIKGVPLMLDYTLRVHYKQQVFTGISIRLRDAIAIHAGVTILTHLQISYSYDILISKFRNYSTGTHEIVLIYNFNRSVNDKNNLRRSKFAHQKYSNLF